MITLWAIYLFGMLALLMRAVEKLRRFGGDKNEEAPIKDGIFWLALWFALLFLYYLIPQVGYLIYLSQKNPRMLYVYSNQIFGIALLFALIFIMLIKGFINPTLNEFIALGCNITITLFVWQFATYSYLFLFYPLLGLIIGIVIHNILKKKYENGNKILWEIPKVWKVVNNRWFLLIFIIIFAVELYFQQMQLSITTFWYYL